MFILKPKNTSLACLTLYTYMTAMRMKMKSGMPYPLYIYDCNENEDQLYSVIQPVLF